MVTARAAYRTARAQLVQAGVEDAAFDAVQLCRIAGAPDPQLAPDAPLTPEQQRRVQALTARRAAREPLQYLAGEWDFLDFTVAVGPGVLIPRADTECVAELAIAAARKKQAPAVLDLCSGTGVLALAVALHVPGAAVTALEVSGAAFAYLAQNNARYQNPLALVQADVFTWAPGENAWDVVVSNPPYVTEEEYRALAPELLAEPKLALTAPHEGLAFYEHIAPACYPALRSGGALVLEIGDTQGPAVAALCRAAGYADVQVHRDLAGNPRAVTARKPSAFPPALKKEEGSA